MTELDLGLCCACGQTAATGMLMLNKRSPYGDGWGCFQCGLPMEGAIAFLCEVCGETGREPQWFCKGEAAKHDRAPVAELTELFEHDLSKHPEASQSLEDVYQHAQPELPPYWRNEVSGQLQPAIEAFICHGAQPNEVPPPTEQQLGLVIQYFNLHINASCWQVDEALSALRESAKHLETAEDCDRWLDQAMELGIDPL